MNKKTSKGLMDCMKRLGLTPTGDSKADVKKLKDSGKVPQWFKR